MRLSPSLALALALAACGGRPAPNPGLEEDLTQQDAAVRDDAGPNTLCTGTTARMEVNGVSPPVMAAGRMQYLDCCDAAEIVLTATDGSGSRLVVSWRHQAGRGPDLPVSLDLAHLPEGWSVVLYAGCSPSEGCSDPNDTVETGLSGTLSIAGDYSTYVMSLCLTAQEQPDSPHPVLHSARVWAPSVHAETPTPR
ncbi:MAG TPA: hypothetical protein VGQ83_21335 [Polyangia bacterium]|jgi:hypothetical protein